MQDEFEAVKHVLCGMGGNRTADEVSEAMASLGRPAQGVEELLNRAVVEAPDEFLKTLDGRAYRYQWLRTRMQVGIAPYHG